MSELSRFVRAEAKPFKTNAERFLSSHVRCCENQHCPYAHCSTLQPKLKHFEQCQMPTCMACASARFTWLFSRQLLHPSHSGDLCARFVSAQKELMRCALSHDGSPTQCYFLVRTRFNEVQEELYAVWAEERRKASDAAPPTAAASCGGQAAAATASASLLNAETRTLHREWDSAVAHAKRARRQHSENREMIM